MPSKFQTNVQSKPSDRDSHQIREVKQAQGVVKSSTDHENEKQNAETITPVLLKQWRTRLTMKSIVFNLLFVMTLLHVTFCQALAIQQQPMSPANNNNNNNSPPAEAATASTEATPKPDYVSLKDRPQLVQHAFENNSTLYYFGLGSNMLRSKVVGRSSK